MSFLCCLLPLSDPWSLAAPFSRGAEMEGGVTGNRHKGVGKILGGGGSSLERQWNMGEKAKWEMCVAGRTEGKRTEEWNRKKIEN